MPAPWSRRCPGTWGLTWGLTGCHPDTPEGPRVPCCAQEPGEGPLGLGVAFDLFCFETNLETVRVGWGLFQNILRSVPERQSRESPAAVPRRSLRQPSARFSHFCSRPPAPEARTQHDAHFAQSHGGPASGCWRRDPGWLPGLATATATH